MSYQCIHRKFIIPNINPVKSKDTLKTKKKDKSENKKKKTSRKSKLKTKNSLSIKNSLSLKSYTKFRTDKNKLLIYSYYKNIKKYTNFIPIIYPPKMIHLNLSSLDILNYSWIYINTNKEKSLINFFNTTKENAVKHVKNIIDNHNKSYYIFDVFIRTSQGPHANVIIFDKSRNEIYCFEPNGYENYIGKNHNKQLLAFFKEIDPDITYKTNKDLLKEINFGSTAQKHKKQFKSESSMDMEGYCFYWCFYILNLILKSNNLSIPEVIKKVYEGLLNHSIGKAKITDFQRHIRNWGQMLEKNLEIKYPKLHSTAFEDSNYGGQYRAQYNYLLKTFRLK